MTSVLDTHHQKQTAELIAQYALIVKGNVAGCVASIERHLTELGPDAEHWLRDFTDAARAFIAQCLMLECDAKDCHNLAVWLHPDHLERYCHDHAMDWDQCPICGDVMKVSDMVSRPMGPHGDLAGHQACVYPVE